MPFGFQTVIISGSQFHGFRTSVNAEGVFSKEILITRTLEPLRSVLHVLGLEDLVIELNALKFDIHGNVFDLFLKDGVTSDPIYICANCVSSHGD